MILGAHNISNEDHNKITQFRIEAILQELGLDREFDYKKAYKAWKEAAELGDEYAEKRCQELIARGFIQDEEEEEELNRGKILVIEDNGDESYLLFKMLNKKKFRVVTAENGFIAMNLLGLHPDINLVMLDLKMPQMNGLQFLKQIRSLDALSGVPIVVMTAYSSPENLARLRKYDVLKCITKPFENDNIIELVESIIEQD